MTELSESRAERRTAIYFGAASANVGLLELLAIVYEMLVVFGASLIAGYAYHITYYGVFQKLESFVGIGIFAAVLHMFIAKSQGLYDAPVLAGLDRRWSRLICGWLLVVLFLTLILFLLKAGAEVSRGSMIVFGFVGCTALVVGRAVFERPLRKAIDRGVLATRRAIVVGSPDELSRLRPVDLLKNYGLSEVHRIFLSAKPDSDAASEDGAVSQAVIQRARELRVDEIVLALRWSDEARIYRICELFRASPLPIHLLPDQTAEQFLSLPILATGPLPTVEMQRAPLSRLERTCKRAFDILAASALLIVFFPVMVAAALSVKLDSAGPIIFRQRRNGFDGRTFRIFKFRTMLVQEDGPKVEQAQPNDPRVTRVGRILRRRSIDELPQLLNVLRGEMSLVGPRPHAIAHDSEFSKLIASYAYRQHVKPGITGLAQVRGLRGPTPAVEDMQKRVEHDLAYISSWSFTLDLHILLRTVRVFFLSNAD
ncbi:putative sugar transferase protein [Bradyrhizobium sp. ORS 278]|uniref:undecaprenyl-phosphate glucose phosphotransferase n=1 Tax=Bradyrhizobium sp. (strain ORS 278) TaxID=114615 RepID=UPI0001508627|nr:undecaprenyl-phosphate glucose phosphotransferase [Bradyrhizobium sp. ORS 278]CAL80648.1 putative sugar transferase protein [Bradyrhizobium sp. ORS 278]